MRNARLAHGRGNGFDRRAERVEQLGHLARAAGLPALLHDEAGQGDDIRVEGRLVRHAEAGLRCAGRQVHEAGAGGGTRRDDGQTAPSVRTVRSLTGQGPVPARSPGRTYRRGSPPPAPGNTSAPGSPPPSECGSAHADPPVTSPSPAAGSAPPLAAPGPSAVAPRRLGAGCRRPPAWRSGTQGHLHDPRQSPALTPPCSCQTEAGQVGAGLPAALGCRGRRSSPLRGLPARAASRRPSSPRPPNPVTTCPLLPALRLFSPSREKWIPCPSLVRWPLAGAFIPASSLQDS